MARYTQTDVATGGDVGSDVNVQLKEIETAIGDTLSRKGDLPNTMESDLDMNSNQILNLPDALTAQEPATLSQLQAAQMAQGLEEAPSDGSTYGRRNEAWAAILPFGGVTSEETTATGGQTIFTAPTYVLGTGTIEVYVNGVKQAASLYSETTTTTITLSSGATAGDLVEVVVNTFTGLSVSTFGDAPSDGTQYARKDAGWEAVVGAVSEAPEDGTPYIREDAGWISGMKVSGSYSITGNWDFDNNVDFDAGITLTASNVSLKFEGTTANNTAWDVRSDTSNDLVFRRFTPSTGIALDDILKLDNSTPTIEVGDHASGATTQLKLQGDDVRLRLSSSGTGQDRRIWFTEDGVGDTWAIRDGSTNLFSIARYIAGVFQASHLTIDNGSGEMHVGNPGDDLFLDGHTKLAEHTHSGASTFFLGDYQLWVDATGDLRIKNGAATSDTDGVVVGTQT